MRYDSNNESLRSARRKRRPTTSSGRVMIRVAIIEDSRQIREGLQQLIGGSEGYGVTGVFGSMEEALEGLPRELPDVALVDIGLPGMSGVDGIPPPARLYPRLHPLGLSVFGGAH